VREKEDGVKLMNPLMAAIKSGRRSGVRIDHLFRPTIWPDRNKSRS
jgi:hypothetical protein